MARRNDSTMLVLGLSAAAFVAAAGVLVVVMGGAEAIMPAAAGPMSRERQAVSEGLRERYWSASVREVQWWEPIRGDGDINAIRVRYTTTNQNGIVMPHDEMWSYNKKTKRVAMMYEKD